MRAVHVVSSIANLASGPSWSVPRLCEELAADGCEVRLDVLESDGRSFERVAVREHGRVSLFGKLGVSPSMRRSVVEALRTVDVVHNHGLWMAPNIYTGLLSSEERAARLVVSPRGTLAPWAWKWKAWKKWPLWHLGQRRAMERADGFHATAEAECDHIRERGFAQPVAVIPIGVDVPPRVHSKAREPREVLFLSRIHPQKGLPMLVRAWAELGRIRDAWRLRIVGPDEGGHAREISELAASLHLDNVSVEGPRFGDQKTVAYQRASLFVLPTHSENFGMVVAEALANGVPVLTTTGAPWSEIEEHDCGWWVEPETGAIAAALESALTSSDERRRAMGRRGREWMEKEYSWRAQATRMRRYYAWLVDGGAVPPFVRTCSIRRQR